VIKEWCQRLCRRRKPPRPISPSANLDLPALRARFSEEFAQANDEASTSLQELGNEFIRRLGRYGSSTLLGLIWFTLQEDGTQAKFINKTLSSNEIQTIEQQHRPMIEGLELGELGDALSRSHVMYMAYSNEQAQAAVAVDIRCMAKEILKRLGGDMDFLKNLILVVDKDILAYLSKN